MNSDPTFSFPPGPVRLAVLLGLLGLGSLSAFADVTGTVLLEGTPGSKDETFYAKANGCGESPIRHTENWKVGPKGELQDVIVWMVDPKFKAPLNGSAPEVAIKQISCRYVPHVVAVKAGTSFQVIDGDPTLHNIRAKVSDGPGTPPGADVFNFGQSYQGQMDERQFDTPGLYTLQCDVHAWMQCWVMALNNDCFAVSDADGAFKVQFGGQLADGDYQIKAWHPRFAQALEQTVHVKDGAATVTFQFDGVKSF